MEFQKLCGECSFGRKTRLKLLTAAVRRTELHGQVHQSIRTMKHPPQPKTHSHLTSSFESDKIIEIPCPTTATADPEEEIFPASPALPLGSRLTVHHFPSRALWSNWRSGTQTRIHPKLLRRNRAGEERDREGVPRKRREKRVPPGEKRGERRGGGKWSLARNPKPFYIARSLGYNSFWVPVAERILPNVRSYIMLPTYVQLWPITSRNDGARILATVDHGWRYAPEGLYVALHERTHPAVHH